jgi:hypothetical protein
MLSTVTLVSSRLPPPVCSLRADSLSKGFQIALINVAIVIIYADDLSVLSLIVLAVVVWNMEVPLLLDGSCTEEVSVHV